MKLSDRAASLIEKTGIALFVIGLGTLAWAAYRFDNLPNYLRLALFLPFAFSVPMLAVDQYRSGLQSLDPIAKGRAIAWLFAPFLLALGTLGWYLIDAAA